MYLSKILSMIHLMRYYTLTLGCTEFIWIKANIEKERNRF